MESAATDPATVLADLKTLRARSRRLAHAGAWLPTLALAALALLSGALYRFPFAPAAPLTETFIQYPYWAGLPDEQRASLASYLFWLLAAPLAFVLVAQWYRFRERRDGIRVPWRVPVVAGAVGLLGLLALFAAPTGETAGPTGDLLAVWDGPAHTWWRGFLTPLLAVAVAAIVLGLVERGLSITAAGAWMAVLAWQFCAVGQLGGLFAWQVWLLNGGSGSGLGGQMTLLGLNRPMPALLIMAGPLAVVGAYWAVRAGGRLS
jgi:hypothetical protein